MRRAETSITDRSLQHCLYSGVDDEVGRGVGYYAILGIMEPDQPHTSGASSARLCE